MYLNNEFTLQSEEEFIDVVTSQLYYLKYDVIIHRIGADSKSSDLIAPTWVLNKLSVVDKIDIKMRNDSMFQGDLYK